MCPAFFVHFRTYEQIYNISINYHKYIMVYMTYKDSSKNLITYRKMNISTIKSSRLFKKNKIVINLIHQILRNISWT